LSGKNTVGSGVKVCPGLSFRTITPSPWPGDTVILLQRVMALAKELEGTSRKLDTLQASRQYGKITERKI